MSMTEARIEISEENLDSEIDAPGGTLLLVGVTLESDINLLKAKPVDTEPQTQSKFKEKTIIENIHREKQEKQEKQEKKEQQKEKEQELKEDKMQNQMQLQDEKQEHQHKQDKIKQKGNEKQIEMEMEIKKPQIREHRFDDGKRCVTYGSGTLSDENRTVTSQTADITKFLSLCAIKEHIINEHIEKTKKNKMETSTRISAMHELLVSALDSCHDKLQAEIKDFANKEIENLFNIQITNQAYQRKFMEQQDLSFLGVEKNGQPDYQKMLSALDISLMDSSDDYSPASLFDKFSLLMKKTYFSTPLCID